MELTADYFSAIQGTTGCRNGKEVKVAEVQNRFRIDFDSSIGVEYDTTRNDILQDFIITPKKDGSCDIKPRVGESVNIGDIIFFNDIHWIVDDKDHSDTLYNGHMMSRCNREIKWQNPVTLEIVSRWCFAERPYANGIQDGNVISVPNRQFRIKLPYDKETMLVDIGRRFMLETIDGKPKTYHLLMPDLITSRFVDSEGGFIVWNLEFDTNANIDKDNIELGVCDYIAPDSPTPPMGPDPTLLTCSISGSSVLRCGGSARSYKPLFYLIDGITLDDTIAPVWTIDTPPEHMDKIISVANGNSMALSCVDDKLVGITFSLTLVDNSSLYTPAELKIEVVDKFG